MCVFSSPSVPQAPAYEPPPPPAPPAAPKSQADVSQRKAAMDRNKSLMAQYAANNRTQNAGGSRGLLGQGTTQRKSLLGGNKA